MDRDQEEMQFLGLFGIYIESCKLIFQCRKIFSQITLALILPLSFIFLAHEKISQMLYWKLRFNEYRLESTQTGTYKYNKLSDLVTSEWITYILFKATYLTFLLIFSLLSTSAVVYTVASVYTSREITFKKVMSVVPKVWKRLMVTFIFTFLAFLAYHMVFTFTLYLWDRFISEINILGPAVIIIVLILYCVGFIYMTTIWLLASVISVLEDCYGLKALIKSKNLIKGKLIVSAVIFFKLNVLLFFTNVLFYVNVVYAWREANVKMIGFGVLCMLLLFKMILFALVVQTVIYFVCKSYHHENIDKSLLSDHLEVYLGDYEPLMAKDVQLEEYRV